MKTWFTADTHFGHENIIGYCQRPFATVEDMDDVLIRNWNAMVRPGDEVWHLGDFANSRTPERYFDRLNGTKHLIRGNHDEHDRRVLGLPWASQRVIENVRVGGVMVVLCHYPMRTWYGAHHGSLHAFGHVHGSLADSPRSCDVGVDRWGYAPMSIEAMRARMAEAPPSPDYPHG